MHLRTRFERTYNAFEASFHIQDFTFNHIFVFQIAVHFERCGLVPPSSRPRSRNRCYADFTETPPTLVKGHLNVSYRGIFGISTLSTCPISYGDRT